MKEKSPKVGEIYLHDDGIKRPYIVLGVSKDSFGTRVHAIAFDYIAHRTSIKPMIKFGHHALGRRSDEKIEKDTLLGYIDLCEDVYEIMKNYETIEDELVKHFSKLNGDYDMYYERLITAREKLYNHFLDMVNYATEKINWNKNNIASTN